MRTLRTPDTADTSREKARRPRAAAAPDTIAGPLIRSITELDNYWLLTLFVVVISNVKHYKGKSFTGVTEEQQVCVVHTPTWCIWCNTWYYQIKVEMTSDLVPWSQDYELSLHKLSHCMLSLFVLVGKWLHKTSDICDVFSSHRHIRNAFCIFDVIVVVLSGAWEFVVFKWGCDCDCSVSFQTEVMCLESRTERRRRRPPAGRSCSPGH